MIRRLHDRCAPRVGATKAPWLFTELEHLGDPEGPLHPSCSVIETYPDHEAVTIEPEDRFPPRRPCRRSGTPVVAAVMDEVAVGVVFAGPEPVYRTRAPLRRPFQRIEMPVIGERGDELVAPLTTAFGEPGSARQLQADRPERHGYLTDTQVHSARCATLWDTLPMSRPLAAPRPRLPRKIISTSRPWATRKMVLAGSPSSRRVCTGRTSFSRARARAWVISRLPTSSRKRCATPA